VLRSAQPAGTGANNRDAFFIWYIIHDAICSACSG
jgi:hypothetical protein